MKNVAFKKNFFLFVHAGLAALCFAYGAIVLASNSGTGFFAAWFSVGMIFVICYVVVALNVYGKIPKFLKKIGWFVVAMFLASFVTIESFIVGGFFSSYVDNLDYIIVLGAQVYPESPSAVLQHRLNAASKYLNQNQNTICIVSGGQGHNEPFPEAIGMKKYLENMGIDGQRIIVETQSKNTEQNITNSMKYIDPGKSVGIVTNNFHMFRAQQIAKKQGLVGAHSIVADVDKLYLPNNMLREYFGELKFLLSQGGG